MSGIKFCPNPDCTNDQIERFTQILASTDDVDSQETFCDLCDTQLTEDQWATVQNGGTAASTGVRSRHRRLVHSISEPSSIRLQSGNQETQSAQIGLDLPLSAEDRHAIEVALSQDETPRGRFDRRSNRRVRNQHRSVSFTGLSEFVSTLPCQQCGHPYDPVRGTGENTPLAYHCRHCDYLTGFDDTYSERDAMELVEMLTLSLDAGTLRTRTCPGYGCENDDVNNFLFDSEDGRLVLRCTLCSHTQPVDCDVSIPRADTGEDISDDEATNVFECNCGNNVQDIFAVYYNIEGQPSKVKCLECDDELNLDTTQSSSEGNCTHPPKGRTEIYDLSTQLNRGDHISWHQSLAYWHHAIVVKVSDFCQKIKVIHYNGPAKEHGGKGIIVEEWLDVDLSKEALYRQDYDNCHPADVVIQRARSRLGETSYNLFGNNCEHFSQWCKTGVARSGQVESAATYLKNLGGRLKILTTKDCVKQGIRLVKVLSKGGKVYNFSTASVGAVGARLANTSAREVGQASVSMAKSGVKDVASSLGKVDYAAMGLVLAIEGYRTYRDVNKAYGQMKRGDISKPEFQRVTIKRVSQGVGGGVGTIVGGALGQFWIPIPFVGGFIGASLGALLGEGLGALTGRHIIKAVHGK